MRPLMVIVLAAGILSLMQGYQWFEASLPRRDVYQYEPPPALGEFAVVITLPFTAEGDDFDPVAVLLQLDGEPVLRKTDRVDSGQLRITLPKVPAAETELYVEIGASEALLTGYRSVRLQLYRDRQLMGERTLWAEPFTRLEGRWRLTIAEKSPEAGDE